jgi:hypothetical protein
MPLYFHFLGHGGSPGKFILIIFSLDTGKEKTGDKWHVDNLVVVGK